MLTVLTSVARIDIPAPHHGIEFPATKKSFELCCSRMNPVATAISPAR